MGKDKTVHSNFAPEKTDERLKAYVAGGKDLKNFNPTSMGLDMFTIPTKYFGWEEITVAFRKVVNYARFGIANVFILAKINFL